MRRSGSARLSSSLALLLTALLITSSGCSDDEAPPAKPANNNPNNNPVSNNNPSSNNNPASNNNPNNNPASNNNPATCQDTGCPGDQRCLSNGRCVDPYNRACVDASDCNPNEECRDVGGANACVYLPTPILACPGAPSCAPDATAPLQVGFAAVVLTPPGFEQPLPQWINGATFEGDPDTLGDEPTFIDCGLDQLCPGDPGYTAPDFGELDGHMQGAWLAGFDHSRAALRWCPPEGACPPDQPWAGQPAHDEIWARAVAFKQGDTTAVLLVVDAVGIFYNRTAHILARTARAADVDLLIIAATHVHEAPDVLGQWGPGAAGSDLPISTGAEPWWLDHVDARAAEAVDQALNNLTPARLYAARGDVGVADVSTSDGRDPWIVDDDLTIIRVADATTDDTLGTLINWSNHPEVLGSGNPWITSDYPGYVRDYIEDGLPEARDADNNVVAPPIEGLGGVAIFISGAVGGIVGPGRDPARDRAGNVLSGRDYPRADAVGQQIADRALTWIQDAPAIDAAPLSFATREFILPLENTQFHTAFYGLHLFDRAVYSATTDAPFSPTNQPSVLTAASILRLGPITFASAPGEIFPETVAGGTDPTVALPFTPVLGDPLRPECGADLLPTLCADSNDCPDNFTCDPRTLNCRATPITCGAACPDGFTCADGRCYRPCDQTCGDGFTCSADRCIPDPPALIAAGIAHPCMIAPDNPNPPDLTAAPADAPVKARLPGSFPVIIGLGHDELGYMVPPYDFKLAEDGAYIIEAEGDHYEETNSIGPQHLPRYLDQLDQLLQALP